MTLARTADVGSRSSISTWMPRVLLALLCAHFLRGVFPMVVVEGDDQGVVNGLQSWARGTGDFVESSYLYSIQPGTYHLLHALHRFTGVSNIELFGMATLACGTLFLVFASHLIAGAVGVRPAWAAVALLSAQEITASVSYANTNAMAGAFTMAGLLIAQRAHGRPAPWVVGVLIGVGGWLRLDSLLLSPAVLVLRWGLWPSRRALRETAMAAVASVSVLVGLLACSGLSPLSAWADFSQRDNLAAWRPLWIHGWLVLGFVPTLVCAVGVLVLATHRQWQALALAIAGWLPSMLVYGGNFTTPKYFFYATPFLMMSGLLWLKTLFRTGSGVSAAPRVLAVGIIVPVIMEAIVGVQTSSPLFRRFDPEPLRIVVELRVAGKEALVGIGEGEILPTADGPRLRGGYFWAPCLWNREKNAMKEELARLDRMMGHRDVDGVVTSTYLSWRVIEGWLRDHGYTRRTSGSIESDNPSSRVADWSDGTHHLKLALVNQTPADAREFELVAQNGRRVLFLNDRGAIGARRLLQHRDDWTLRSPSENNLTALYERRAR